MSDPFLILRWGDLQVGAYGYFAVALVGALIVLNWWLARGR
jgi:hypothetical protein